MSNRILALIAISMIICWSSDSYASQEIKQETKGDQSPAITVLPGGRSELHYDVSDEVIAEIKRATSEIKNEYNRMLELAIEFQDKKLKELNRRLAEIYIERTGSSNDNAKKWAQEIIEKSSEVKKALEDKKTQTDKYNIELSKNIVAKVYMLFGYVFGYVDSRLLAIKDLNPDVKYNINEYVVFDDEKSNVGTHKARAVDFPNGSKIEISVNPGNLEGVLVKGCPTISFREICKDECLSFSLRPSYGCGLSLKYHGGSILKKHEKISIDDIKYNPKNANLLTDDFKRSFTDRFDKFIKYTYGR